jgi:sarcosine oxidase, subunit delta
LGIEGIAMKVMNCPLNGPRNIDEFVCGGAVKSRPAPGDSAANWARFAYLEANHAGAVFEWWLHVPSGYWFIAERDTRGDEILRTMSVDAFAALKRSNG